MKRYRAAAPAIATAMNEGRDSSGTTRVQGFKSTGHRTALGTVELIDGPFTAVDTTGQTLGKFATLRAAVASFGRPQ